MSGDIETNPGPRRGADDKPGLDDLLCMSYTGEDGRDVHFRLMDQLKPHWRRLAIALNFPQYEITAMKYEDDPVLYLMSEWLQGANQEKDPRPVTWGTLFKALKQADCQEEVAILAKHLIAPYAGLQHFPGNAKENQSLSQSLSTNEYIIFLLIIIITSITMGTDKLSFTVKLQLLGMYTMIIILLEVKELLIRGPLKLCTDRLKQVYQAPPPTWGPLPQCGHIKLAMIREKGKRRGIADEEIVKHQVKGAVENIMANQVPIDKDKIFDSDLFDQKCQVILVEGPPGGGKTSLAYYYAQKWASGNLSMFDVVAFVRLCDLAVTPASTLPDLLLLACHTTKNTSTEAITKEIIHQCADNSPKFLLVLDGWDTAPNNIRMRSYIISILESITPQSKILITSRPGSSVDLHGLANRVEIVGFSKENIHGYFEKALSTELDHDEVEDGCRKLQKHFHSYPVIQSCCYIPLNAVILASLYLSKQSLPSTRHELFLKLVLSCINREQQDRHSQIEYVCISSLNDLPRDLRVQLNHLCVLAFEGVKQNKVVFTEEDLVRLNLPLDLPGLGVLQIVDRLVTIRGKTPYCYFIHLSIQELLAAYHISQLRKDEQMKVFKSLLDEPRFSAVLQFYAAFTRLTNQGVRNIITGRDFDNTDSSQLNLLNIMRCLFEAQLHDDTSLYQEIIPRLNGVIYLSDVTMTPLDCMSIGYFMASLPRADGKISVHLCRCGIDDYSLGLLVGEFSKHAEVCPAGVMQAGATELDISWNDKITEIGIAHVLRTNITNKLKAEHCGISNLELKSLASALAVNSTLEELDISNNSTGDSSIARIGTALQSNTTLKILNMNIADCVPGGGSPPGLCIGALQTLARALKVNSSLEELKIINDKISDNGIVYVAESLQRNTTLKVLHVGTRLSKEFLRITGFTDTGVLSLARGVAANTSIEHLSIQWYSTDPDSTLKRMGEIVKESNLKTLALYIGMCIPAPAASVHTQKWPKNEVKEMWYHSADVGGKELIMSQENSHLKSFRLNIPHHRYTSLSQSETAACLVTKARRREELPDIHFSFRFIYGL